MSDERTRIDVAALRERVSVREAVEAFVPGIVLRRQGRELVCLSPLKTERTPSFTIDERRGLFFCFATQQGGDAIRFVELLEGVDFATAARRLAERCLGDVPVTREDAAATAARAERRRVEMAELEAREAAEQRARIAAAERIWRDTVPGFGSIVATYLAARGIDLEALATVYGRSIPGSLRFGARVRGGEDHVGPAMVGLMTGADGRGCGIHRTFLAPDGRGKAPGLAHSKLTLGKVWGAVGVLSPVDGADHAVIGEGYETTLTVMAALARRGIRVVGLSALSLGNLAGGGVGRGARHPTIAGKWLPSVVPDADKPGMMPPAGIKRVTILEDADGRDPLSTRALIERAVAKFQRAGLRVSVATPPVGADFNDMVRAA